MEQLDLQRIEKTIKALNANGIDASFLTSRQALFDQLNALTKQGDTVACGGSVTLEQTGVLDYLRSGRFVFLDRYLPSHTPKEIQDIFYQSFKADVYFMSSNAITEDGKLYNVDRNGNRIAALAFGPKKVIVVAGYNKLVKDEHAAAARVKAIAAPKNAARLQLNTPCVKVGHCVNCNSEDTICCYKLVTKKQAIKGRIHVLLLNEVLGY